MRYSMKSKLTLVKPFGLVFILALGIFASCSEEEVVVEDLDAGAAATDLSALIPDAVPVRQEALRDRIVGNGVIQGQREAILRSRTGGIIRSISFELGGSLEEGAVLLTLDDAIASLTLRQLEQQYQINLADLRSKEDLYSRGSLALNQLTQARATVNGLEAQLVQARDAVANTRITTPIQGQIAEKSAGLVLGDQLQAGAQIGRIVDLSALRVSVALGQSQVFLVREGLPAEIRVPTPTGDIVTQGVVHAVSAGSDRRTGSWTALIDFPNPAPDLIRAGLSAQVSIVNADAPKSIVVPDSALVFREGRTAIYLVEENTPVLVQVRLVDQQGERTAIEPVDPSIVLLGKRVLVSGLNQPGVVSGEARLPDATVEGN